jgi:hypothetical protein
MTPAASDVPAVRFLLLLEGIAFTVASVIHSGRLVHGYAHLAARNAEAVIAAVLLGAWVLTWIRPLWFRRVSLMAQAFALAGTLVGVFTTIVGVGPRTTPDVIYHGNDSLARMGADALIPPAFGAAHKSESPVNRTSRRPSS